MNQDLSIVQLMLNASWVVQAVVLLLVLMSLLSWAAIFRKLGTLKRVKGKNDDFEREFWSGTNLNELYAAATQNARQGGPMERIFASGMREFQKLLMEMILTKKIGIQNGVLMMMFLCNVLKMIYQPNKKNPFLKSH